MKKATQTVGAKLNADAAVYRAWRIKKLKKLKAPQTILELEQKILERAKKGELRITGDKEALELTYESSEEKKGRGGKLYQIIATKEGRILNYFPNAMYGRFIKFAN